MLPNVHVSSFDLHTWQHSVSVWYRYIDISWCPLISTEGTWCCISFVVTYFLLCEVLIQTFWFFYSWSFFPFFFLNFKLKDKCFTEEYLLYRIFCQTSTWISHKYTYVPSFLNLSPISLPIPTLSVVTEPLFKFPEPYCKFLLAIYFTYGSVSFRVTFSIHLTLFSLLPMSVSLFSMSVSPLLPCK